MGIINTIDLDYSDKDRVQRVLTKIRHCVNMSALMAKNSLSKGYHITLICKAGCDLCRFIFDDPKRYAIDFKRPAHLQNVLFDNYRYREREAIK